MNSLNVALTCANGLGNPFIHMRLGQARFELGNLKRADDELTRAYMGAGREIFKDENPKCFDRLRDILLPPPGRNEL